MIFAPPFGRDVIETIGLFDEQFGLGCFEDDDYCLRALRAGYRLLIAHDSFVRELAEDVPAVRAAALPTLVARDVVHHGKS